MKKIFHHLAFVALAFSMFGCMHRNSSSFNSKSTIDDVSIYSAAYGNSSDQPLVFVHGGPGHNSYDFELTTARNLASRGFFVIVYDQRGQGRSSPPKRISNSQRDPSKIYLDMDLSGFTYRQYADDLLNVIRKHVLASNVKKPVLLAHSHGGPIAIQFHAYHPQVSKGIVLLAAPVDFFGVMESMYQNCGERIPSESFGQLSKIRASGISPRDHWTGDLAQKTVATVASMFSTGMTECNLYHPRTLEDGAMNLWGSDPDGEIPKPPVDPFDIWSMPGFIAHELYFQKDHSEIVARNKGIFFGIYADADGLFNLGSRAEISSLINSAQDNHRFVTLVGPSHNLYWQAQTAFFEALESHILRM